MNKHIAFFNEKKKNGDFSRLGKLFRTEKQQYMYDLGTGKVVQCTEEEFLILENIFANNGLKHYEDILLEEGRLEEALVGLENSINTENLLMAPKLKGFIGPYNDVEFAIGNKVQQITLDLTQKCNLKCNYCINGESFHRANENGTAKDMPIETAKAAIDYLFLHADDSIAVTFYGGEPLLKFDLLKELVEYSKRKNEDAGKTLTFSMTTNLVLMTKEIAQYFASVGGFGILCSLDGPEQIHDEHRVMRDGNGSFKRALAGLKLLVEAYGEKAGTYISINSVLTPPYTMEKFDKMQEFYHSLPWLPKDLSVETTYVSMFEGSELSHVFNEAHGNNSLQKPFTPLHDWIDEHRQEEGGMFCSKFDDDTYLFIHKRAIYDEPVDGYPLQGCCVPGARRLHISVDGDYTVCERVDNAPILGNVQAGVDINLVKERYLKDYMLDSLENCSKCWAARLCRICFVDCFNKEKEYDSRLKKANCENERAAQEMQLIRYHQVLEDDPESLNHLNDIFIV